MSKQQYILAVDQGTSSTKSLIFDERGQVVAKGSEPLQTKFFNNGFVEQEAEGIYQNVLASVRKCLAVFAEKGFDKKTIAGIGISNQRETFVVWDKEGQPLHNALVWQCKRSIAICERMKKTGIEEDIKKKTGLLIDPYFSGTKLVWLNESIEKVRTNIDKGDAYFGTVDTWLLYKLTGGKNYLTDYTNASRTLFFNLKELAWDKSLLKSFGLEKINLPEPKPSSCYFGETNFEGLFDSPVPVTGMIGDSHAAAFGENCFFPGTAKATLGTGSSIMMNIGADIKQAEHGIVTTICWATESRVEYAFEGIIVSCGSTIEWLKNELGLVDDSKAAEEIARSVADNNGVYLIPAFSGLGAPHWDMTRKASITGLTFDCNKNHIIRAALESIPYQVKDVIVAMEQDAKLQLKELMVDGGITSNQFVIQFLTDLLDKPVVNIGQPDVSALGAAYMAGLKAGVYNGIDQLATLHPNKKVYSPSHDSRTDFYYTGWKKALTE